MISARATWRRQISKDATDTALDVTGVSVTDEPVDWLPLPLVSPGSAPPLHQLASAFSSAPFVCPSMPMNTTSSVARGAPHCGSRTDDHGLGSVALECLRAIGEVPAHLVVCVREIPTTRGPLGVCDELPRVLASTQLETKVGPQGLAGAEVVTHHVRVHAGLGGLVVVEEQAEPVTIPTGDFVSARRHHAIETRGGSDEAVDAIDHREQREDLEAHVLVERDECEPRERVAQVRGVGLRKQPVVCVEDLGGVANRRVLARASHRSLVGVRVARRNLVQRRV
jgi:hypothetical protein